MIRFPIFVVFLFISIFSCSEKTNKTTIPNNNNQYYIDKAKKYQNLGYEYFMNKKQDSAFYYFNESKELFEAVKDSNNIVYNLIQMASIQKENCDHYGVEESLVEAIPYLKKGSNYELALYNLLGITAKEMHNYNEALFYYKKVKNNNNDNLNEIIVNNNIASVYIQKKDYQTAITILNAIKNFKILDTVQKIKAIYLDNLGFAYYKANQVNKGLQLMQEATNIKEKINDSYGSIESYLHLADYYQNIEKYKAAQYAIKAYKTATSSNSINERLKSLACLINNPVVHSKKYAIQYAFLNDSITKIRTIAKNQFAKIKYDSRKAKAESAQYKLEKIQTELQLKQSENQKYLSFFGIIFLFSILIYLNKYYKKRNKKQIEEATYKTETRIAEKLHDELANDVYHTMTFAQTQDLQNLAVQETLINNLDKIYTLTRNISKENSVIDTGEDYENYLKQILDSYKTNTVSIIIKKVNPIDWSKMQKEKKTALQRILQELMVNMKKHSQANFVIIGFDTNGKNILINYSDNGRGTVQKDIIKGGLLNVENRIQSINGSVTFETSLNKGFKVSISFPK